MAWGCCVKQLFDKTNPRKKDPTPSEREAHVQQEREMLQARILELSQQNAELAGALEEAQALARRVDAERDIASLADAETLAQLPQKVRVEPRDPNAPVLAARVVLLFDRTAAKVGSRLQ